MTMSEKKITKREMFVGIMGKLTDEADIAFIQERIDELDRRAEKTRERAEARKVEGDELREAIYNVLGDTPRTIPEILAALDDAELTPNKITARLTQLVKLEKVNEEQFVSLMNDKGYQVNWSNSRKNITYTTPENKRVRDSNLAKTFKNENLLKENLLKEFSRNAEKFREPPKDELETIQAQLKEIQDYRHEISEVMQKLESIKREKEKPLIVDQQSRAEIEKLKMAIQDEQNRRNSLGFFKMKEKKNCDDRINKYSEQIERLEGQLLTDDKKIELSKEINEVQQKLDIADKQYHKHDTRSHELLEREYKIKQERRQKHREIEHQQGRIRRRTKDLGYER